MVVTLHEILPDIRLDVVEKAYQALKKGGKLIILDFPYPCEISEFRDARFEYGILDQFYEICAGTEHLNSKEQSEILSKVGFNNIQRIPIGKGMLEFVMAIK